MPDLVRVPGVAATMLLTGCLTTPLQRAESMGARKLEVAAEAGVASVQDFGQDSAVTPAANVAVRYGVSERFDLGLRLGSAAYEVQTKLELTPEGAGVPVSVAPSFTVTPRVDVFGDALAFSVVRVPVLIGIPLGRSQLVLGPGVDQTFVTSSGDFASVTVPRLSLGVSWQLAPGVRIHPEVAAGVNAITWGEGGGQASPTTVLTTAAVAFAFGSAYPAADE